jgi:hypothetical protein
MRRRVVSVAAAVAIVAVAGWIWTTWRPDEERQIRARLSSLAEEFNTSAADGLGLVAKAARMGTYFSDDVTIDLGPGSAAIVGRDTLMGMAARLQPRTSVYTLSLDDVAIDVAPEKRTAKVALTLIITRTSGVTGKESLDAREFSVDLRKLDGEWRISRAAAVDTLR